MVNIQASTWDEYFAQCGPREPELRELDALIRESAPGLAPVLFGGMSGTMLGYGMQPYKSASAKVASEWPLLALANQKRHMSLYVCAVLDGKYAAEIYEPTLGKVKIGKSCIRFTKVANLDLDGVRAMVSDLDARMASGERLISFWCWVFPARRPARVEGGRGLVSAVFG
ncbi:DUF1801 domain-containing protein [Tomitella biformata]|uniref:DUF1801 domain-containing protein n=1 Tax=Tomitella biformata TaxID=630403 RepID=UPI000466B69B|nr:DUF1801 domain-containing protein [Tomitella biformata]